MGQFKKDRTLSTKTQAGPELHRHTAVRPGGRGSREDSPTRPGGLPAAAPVTVNVTTVTVAEPEWSEASGPEPRAPGRAPSPLPGGAVIMVPAFLGRSRLTGRARARLAPGPTLTQSRWD
jgi:hypothetical protein